MKIAIFSECYRPTRNGVTVSIDTFAAGLRDRGHEVHIFAPRRRGDTVQIPCVHRCPSAAFPYFPEDYPLPLPLSPAFLADFNDFAPDLVHCQSVFFTSWLGVWLARRRQIPVVTTYHTLIAEYLHYVPLPHTFTSSAARKLSRCFCNLSDCVIVPTESVRPVLTSYGVTAPIHTLATGIRVEEFQGGDPEIIRRRHGLDAETPVLLFVGRIAKEKNIEFLLHAMRALNARRPAQMLFVGSGPYREQAIEATRRLRIDHRVHLCGSQPRQDLRHYYAAARLFAFASRTETQGIVLGEAMAAGVPVVVVRSSGVCDVVRDGIDGLVVPVNGDPTDAGEVGRFADALARVLDDPALWQRMANAAVRGADRFSVETSTRALEQVYDHAGALNRLRQRESSGPATWFARGDGAHLLRNVIRHPNGRAASPLCRPSSLTTAAPVSKLTSCHLSDGDQANERSAKE